MVAKYMSALALAAVLSVAFAADPVTTLPADTEALGTPEVGAFGADPELPLPADTEALGSPEAGADLSTTDFGGDDWGDSSDVPDESYMQKYPKPETPCKCYIKYKKCCEEYCPKWSYDTYGNKYQCGWIKKTKCGYYHKIECTEPWCQYFYY
jgi:hypothetical protein